MTIQILFSNLTSPSEHPLTKDKILKVQRLRIFQHEEEQKTATIEI